MTYTWPDTLTRLACRKGLETKAAQWTLNEALSDHASKVQLTALLVAPWTKGKTEDEIEDLSFVILGNALRVILSREAAGVVGTGGGRASTVNIFTMATLVASAAEAEVAEHDSQVVSSQAGTANIPEELDIKIVLEPERQMKVLGKVDIIFLFTQFYHPAMKHVTEVWKQLAVQTTFGFLDPLPDSTRPQVMAFGVTSNDITSAVAWVLARRRVRGLVFRGLDGLNELTIISPSDVQLLADGRVYRTTLDLADLGLPPVALSDLRGGDAQHSAQVARGLVAGRTDPVRDIVVPNTTATLPAYHGASSVVPLAKQPAVTPADANRTLGNGGAQRELDAWIRATGA